jgi:hypothetical protein
VPVAPPFKVDPDNLDELKDIMRWAAETLGRHMSYPRYDAWRLTTQHDWCKEHGVTLALPSSKTLMGYLGGGKWLPAKVAAGLLSEEEAARSWKRRSRTDSDLCDALLRALAGRDWMSRRSFREYYNGVLARARRDGRREWVPSDDCLLDRLGGPTRDWDVAIAAALSHAASHSTAGAAAA